MSQALSCSEIESWVQHPGSDLSASQAKQFEEHLESCPTCQALLDSSTQSADPLLNLARRFGDPTLAPTDTALDQVLSHLRVVHSPMRTESTIEPADLYFLRPPTRPGLLGMLANYEVEELIGQGGMGIVLKAFDPSLHRPVAIKVMAAAVAGSATARRRFTREAQAAASICHDHVITVHGVSEADGLPFLVMQYVAGESLQARVDRVGPLELEEVVRIGLQTAQGLAAAHAQGLIHRDIKPANLLLENGLARVKITDFGLARMTDDVSLTQNGVVAGTPEYMAPEQARGEPVDHRSDLFSLGSVLYAMCAGAAPFRSANTVAILRKVSDENPPPLHMVVPNLPLWIDQFIRLLMAKDPARRIQSSAEAATLLEGYLAHLRQPATAPAPELPMARESREVSRTPFGWPQVRALGSRLWPAALLLLAGLGLGGGMIGWGLAGGDDQTQRVAPGDHIHQVLDFRKPITSLTSAAPVGPEAGLFLRTDDQGLRINLPMGRRSSEPVGLEWKQRLRGDFVVEAGYEILSINGQIPEQGAGVHVRITLDSRPPHDVLMNRLRKPPETGKTVVGSPTVSRETLGAFNVPRSPDGKETWKGVNAGASSARGRMRFVRTGVVVDFYAIDGDGPLRKIHSEKAGTDDVVGMRLQAVGDVSNHVEVRFTELVIDAENIGTGSETSVSPPTMGNEHAPHTWLTIAGGLVVMLVAFMAASALAYARVQSIPRPENEVQPEELDREHQPRISFTCPGCGVTLRVRAELAGRQGKCPQCGAQAIAPKPDGTPAAPRVRRSFTTGMKIACGLGLALVLGPACWLLAGGSEPGTGELSSRFHQDLHAVDLSGPYLKPVNQDVESGPGGVRILIPAGRDKPPPAGITLTTVVHGDFEITTQFEILKADVPATGSGVGVGLDAQVANGPKNVVSLARRVVSGGAGVFVTDRAMGTADGKETHRTQIFPANTTAGKLRLKRVGSVVHFQIAEGDSAEFTELDQVEIGTEDIQYIQAGGHTGGSNAGLDMRLLDFTVEAEDLPGLPGAARSHAVRTAILGVAFVTGFALLIGVGWRLRPAFSHPLFGSMGAELPAEPTQTWDAEGSQNVASRWRRIALAFAIGIPVVFSISMALLAGAHGDPSVATDVRFTDLSIKTESPMQAASSSAVDSDGEGGWLGAVIAMVVTTVLAVCSLLLAVRAGWLAARSLARATTSSSGSFLCAGCGKSIRVKAGWAGKKGKCLQCGTEAIVPAIEVW